jgi:hypothetical protein
VLLWVKRSIAACVRRLLADGGIHQETGTLGTMTRDLLELADLLPAEGVTHVAIESTGSYWKPVIRMQRKLQRGIYSVGKSNNLRPQWVRMNFKERWDGKVRYCAGPRYKRF